MRPLDTTSVEWSQPASYSRLERNSRVAEKMVCVDIDDPNRPAFILSVVAIFNSVSNGDNIFHFVIALAGHQCVQQNAGAKLRVFMSLAPALRWAFFWLR
jgi:hypothetical protein